MCFSYEVSLATFVFTWSICIYLLNKKLDSYIKKRIIFLMLYSTVQIPDAILWKIKLKKNNINYIITSYIIPILLSLQILYNVFYINNESSKFIHLISLCFIIYLFIKLNGYSTQICNGKNNSPVWGSNEFKLWELVLFASLIFYPDWKLYLTGGIILIFFTYYFNTCGYGSMWCALANIYAIYLLITIH